MIEALNFLWQRISSYFDEYKKRVRPWNWSVSVVTQSQYFTYNEGATAFMFTNTGAVDVLINGKVLHPSATPGTVLGDAFSIAAHKDDVFKGTIQISFAAGAGPAVEVVQILYMDVKQR